MGKAPFPNCGKPGCLLAMHKPGFAIPHDSTPEYKTHVQENLHYSGKFEITEGGAAFDSTSTARHPLELPGRVVEKLVGLNPGILQTPYELRPFLPTLRGIP